MKEGREIKEGRKMKEGRKEGRKEGIKEEKKIEKEGTYTSSCPLTTTGAPATKPPVTLLRLETDLQWKEGRSRRKEGRKEGVEGRS